jgi:hypothetical protein
MKVQVGSTFMDCQEVLPVPYALGLRPGATIRGNTTPLYLTHTVVGSVALQASASISVTAGYTATGSPTSGCVSGEICSTDDIRADGSLYVSDGFIRTGTPASGYVTGESARRACQLK